MLRRSLPEYENETITDELAEAIVYGLEDLEIHNDGGSMPILKEITLFTLFQAINSLPSKFIDQAYEIVYECCKLTDNAYSNFEKSRARYQHLKTSPYVLVKMLKIWRSDYFESEIKPLINGNDIVIHKIDFKDEFTMQTIRARTEEGYYKEFKTVIEDLSKVIRFIDNVTLIYIQEAKNIN